MTDNETPKAPELITVFTELFRGAARPAVTIIFAAVIAQCVIEGRAVPEWFLALAIPIISWWFAVRTVSHLRSNSTVQVENLADTLSRKVVARIHNTTHNSDPKGKP